MIDMIDEMTVDWGLNPIPVVADMSHQRDLDAALRALEERRMHYALKVDPNQRALTIRSGPGAARAVSFARFIADSLSRNTIIVNTWGTSANRPGRIRLLAARLPPAALSRAQVDSNAPVPAHSLADRYIATEWSPSRNSPLAAWVSAPDPRRVPGPISDVGLHHQATADLDEMHDGLGLRHFEGRSFPGWHHHVTLVSVAHSHRVLQGIADGKKALS
jgi:hypothetical protein